MRNFFRARNNNDRARRGLLANKRFSLESLEDRLLLTAVPNDWGILAEETAALGAAGQAQIGFDVRTSDGAPAVLGLLVSGNGEGSVDPGMIRIRNAENVDVTDSVVIKSSLDYADGKDALFLLDISEGVYAVSLTADPSGAEGLTCSVFMPGDVNRDGDIGLDEYKMGSVYAAAWGLCQSGVPSLGVIEYYLKAYNIDLTDIESVYNARYDVNMDGEADCRDVDIFRRGYYQDVTVSFSDLIRLRPIDRALQTAEGEIGCSDPLLPDSFVAEIQGNVYTSAGYDVSRFEQIGAVLSTGGAWEIDCTDLISFTGDGRFAFDATPEIFEFLAAGQTLTLSFDYYLDHLTFDGLDLVYQNQRGGSVVATVVGVNDAPRGAGDYAARCDLRTGAMTPTINVLNGIADPEGEALTASIDAASIGGNDYGIPTDDDYSFLFTVTPKGIFGVDGAALADLLEAVPEGEEVTFTVRYLAADPWGASDVGAITLTVIGKNDAPRGAGDYTATFDLETGRMTPTVNLLDGVADPDDDSLTLTIDGAVLAANDYGIPTGADYAAYFSVGADGVLSVSRAALSRALQAVPAGGTVVFTIPYTAADPDGESTGGVVTLTIAGRNEAPTAADVQLTGALDDGGALTFTIDLFSKVTDPDGDAVEATGFTIGGADYAPDEVDGLVSDGYIYTYDAETGIMTVAAAPSTAENLKWFHNAADGTFPVQWFFYRVSDGAASAQGTVTLSLRAEDDAAEVTSNPADQTLVKNPSAAAGETTSLGTARYLADRYGYTVSVTVTDEEGNVVSVGALAGLVTASSAGSVPNFAVGFAVDDVLVNALDTDGVYTVSYELVYNGTAEAAGSFAFTVKDLQVSQWNGTVSVAEGERGSSDRTLEADGFTAEIGGTEYRSVSFTMGGFVQTSAALSDGTAVGGDFASYLFWDDGTGRFVFDAASPAFDFLPAGETLTVTVDFYLDNLRFDGIADVYDGIKGGEVAVVVTGVNDAPRGAGDYSAALPLTTGVLNPNVNLLSGVIDPDGDELTPRIVSAYAAPNNYGIPTGADYSSCFSVGDGGFFAADAERLTKLLAAVPRNQSLLFSVKYAVLDPSGAETSGTVSLTVVGRNEGPSGASDYSVSYDAATGELEPEVNVLSGVTDPDGDALTASVTGAYAEKNDYIPSETDYGEYFGFDAEGNFFVDGSIAGLMAAVPAGSRVVFNVGYTVSDPYGASDAAAISVTCAGTYDAPAFVGEIADVSGGYGESVSIDLAGFFTGSITEYEVEISGNSAILADRTINGSVLTFTFLDDADYASNLNLADLTATVTASDAAGNKAVSNPFAVSLDGAQTLTLTLACVTEEFGGKDVSTLRTGRQNFGTFYYIDKDNVPRTNYEEIALESDYYLELWVSDVSALLTGKNKFFSSIQAQLNYETDGLGITALDLEDVYAGVTSMAPNLYYDGAETLLKAIQVTWLFKETDNWSLLEPITNGENAFLLARFTVSAETASSITLSGVDEEAAGFTKGYYCVRTGEYKPVDESQIKTVNVETAPTSPIRGAGGTEYVAAGGVYLRTVTEKTEVDASGHADTIGVNADFIHEWQPHYSEIWVKGSDLEAVGGVSVDLTFDASYFDAAEVEFGAAFADGSYVCDSARGVIENISARAADGALGADGYYLLARVKYTPAEGADLGWNASLTPTRLEWSLGGAELLTAAGTRSAYVGAAAVCDLWANPYDVNDDGSVNVIDFVAFSNWYGGSSTDDYAGAFFDFNRDGTVDLRDFTSFSNVYGLSRADVAAQTAQLVFPESFTRRYLGSTLDADNAALVGSICDAAVSAWNEKLGGETNPDLLIVVKNLPDGQLAAAQAAEVDPATGRVTHGTIYLDDDAAGARWSAQMTPPAADSTRYDLYSVILHELGHLYGYSPENGAFVSVAGDFDWVEADGHSNVAADLMYPFLEPGVRKEITVRDAAVVAAVRQDPFAERTAEAGAARREILFALPETEDALWSLDFAEEATDDAASVIVQKINPAIWDDGFDGDLW
ncbi:MAG: hypothetical protein IK105_08555 [Thermoguttaceae bacterium]|nr:hypothetical protein [Thermoguttaceae bacterium]